MVLVRLLRLFRYKQIALDLFGKSLNQLAMPLQSTPRASFLTLC